jgi:hypothetical protein
MGPISKPNKLKLFEIIFWQKILMPKAFVWAGWPTFNYFTVQFYKIGFIKLN